MSSEELLLKIGIQSDLRSLSSINSELKKLESGVKNLNNSMKNGGRSLEDYKSKSAMLQRQIELNAEKMNRLKTRISENKQKMEEYQKQIEELSQSEGDNSKAIEALTKKYQNAAADINKTEVELRNVQESTKNLTTELENNNRAVENFSLQKLSDKAKEAGENIQKLGEKVSKAGEEISKVGQGITNTFLPIASAGILATQQAISFEEAWAGVLKTVNADDATLQNLQEGLIGISERAPVSANELFGLAEIAGQLGVEAPNIEKFVETISQLGVTTNISAEEGAQSLAQFLNITGGGTEVVDRLASAIVDCGNNFSTTENDILNLAMRIAGVGTTVGLTEAQIIGLSTAMSSVGITAEAGGTAISTVMSDIDSAVSQGGETLEAFAQVAGMSSEEFKQAWEQDASSALVVFLEQLHNLDESGADTTTILSDLFGESSNIRDVMLRLAGNTDLVTEALGTANNAWEENTALSEEAAKRYETTASQMEIMKNKIQNIGVKIGQALLPAFNDLLDSVESVVEWFGNLDPEVSATIIKFGMMATAVGIGTNAFGKFVGNVGNVLSTVGKVSKGLGTITDMTSKTGKAISTLSSMTTTAIPALSGLTTTASGGASALGLLTTAALPVAGVIATAAAGIYAYHEYNEALNDSLLKTTDEMSWLEEGFRKLNGVQAYSREELEDLGLVYKDFNENISEDFRNKVEEMTTDIHDFGMSIEEINIDGMITEEEANKVSTRVEEALNNCLTAIDSKNEEMQKGLAEAFNIDGVIDDNEKSLLEYWSTRGETERNEAINLQHEINDIIANARAEGRELRPEEEQAIMDYYAQIKQLELIAMADNSYELEYASQEFQNRMMTADAETAEKLLTQRHEQYQEQQLETKTHYDTLIAQAKEGYDGLSEEEKRKVDETVQNLESAKQAALDGNTELYEADIAYAEEHCENLNMVWNKYRAEKVAAGDVANYQEYEQMREHYEGIEQITKSGYQRVYDTATGTWKDLYVSIDETTGELKGVYDLNTQNVAAMTQDDESTLRDEQAAWAQTSEGVLANCMIMGTGYVDFAGTIRDESGNAIGKLVEVQDETGNTRKEIQDLNGNPIDIGENSQDVIDRLNSVSREVTNLDGKKANIDIVTNHIDNYIQKYNNQGPGATKYEQGTHGTLGAEQLAHVNESVRGSRAWELVDGPAKYLGSDSIGDKVLLGIGASVKSNVTSTGMMIKAVQEEVQKQLADVYLDYGNSNSSASRLAFNFGNPSQNIFNNSNFDDSNIVGVLMSVLGAIQGQNMSPVINLDAKSIARATYKYTDKFMQQDLKRRY